MTAGTSSRAQPAVRRLTVYSLLFALVVAAAIGLAGLLGRLFDTGLVLAEGDAAGLASSLAFTLIAGPLAAVLWRVVWTRLPNENERGSVAWGLYLAAMYTVALIAATQALLGAVTSLIRAEGAPRDLGSALVWSGVLLWHRWMLRDPARRPRRLTNVPVIVGFVYGLVVGVAGGVDALAVVFGQAISTIVGEMAAVGYPWWQPALQSLAWAGVGFVLWWWHWSHDRARSLRTTFATVAVIVSGILGGGILTVGGLGVSLFVVLRLAVDRSDPIPDIVEPWGTALASAAVGALIWEYYRGVTARRARIVRETAALVTAGIGLVATASGLGVIVNALLASVTPTLVGGGSRTLLLGGISSVVVGGPLWWASWQPFRPVSLAQAASPARRIYLIVVFGLSAIVALVTLLVLGYRVFEFVLNDNLAASLLDRVRAPVGLLLATALVAAYHFVVWRRELGVATSAGLVSSRRIGRIILVSGANAAAEAEVLHAISGAPVTIWPRAESHDMPYPNDMPDPHDAVPRSPDAAQFADALGILSAKRVLVVVGPGSRIEAIQLAD